MAKDELLVQISWNIKAPPGVKITKRVLQELTQRLVDHRPLPKNVKVRGIFWRNPKRRGSLSDWRYHKGADLRVAPAPLESSPRGSLQDAIDTLAPFLETAEFTF